MANGIYPVSPQCLGPYFIKRCAQISDTDNRDERIAKLVALILSEDIDKSAIVEIKLYLQWLYNNPDWIYIPTDEAYRIWEEYVSKGF